MKQSRMYPKPALRIDVVSDLVSPWCYLAVRRLQQALTRIDGASKPALRWRPYEINPALPAEGVEVDAYLETIFGSREAGRAVLTELENTGQEEGIRFDFDRVPSVPNTMDAHRLILLAEEDGHGQDMAGRLFRGFFEEGRDIGQSEELAQLADEAGIDRDRARTLLAGDRYRDSVRLIEARIREAGFTGVPTFVVNERVAFGGVQEPDTILAAIDKALFHGLPEDEEPPRLH
ncbi:MAG: DsbA family oxidoreductase [Gammaproteobacteria bacterium]|nr:MAG: DsbA family oxidoreductase [Gammaproteobacteria bacterium]